MFKFFKRLRINLIKQINNQLETSKKKNKLENQLRGLLITLSHDIKRLSWKRNVKASLKEMGILMSHWAHKQSIRNFKEEVEEEEKEVEKLVKGITYNLSHDIKRLSLKKNVKASLKDMRILMFDWANKQSITNFKEEEEEEVEKSVEGSTAKLKSGYKKDELEKECKSRSWKIG